MESSDCRPGATDAEQSAPSYIVTVKCEPAMVKEEPEWGECGVSEAAAAEGLYDGHKVKNELVVGPELMQQQDIAFSLQNAQSGMEGLCKPKLEVEVEAAPDCTQNSPGDGPGCIRSTKQQYVHRNVLSRAEDDPCKLQPAGEAAPATQSTRAQADVATRQHTHTGQKRYSCDICHKQFTKRFQLTNHIRIHTGEKPYSCNICNKRFTEKSAINRHVRTHTGEKPYSCDTCNERFGHKWALTRHMRIHTGHKSYSCDVCNKQFKHKMLVTYHARRIHTGEKPYSCNVCNKRFTEKSTMNRHIRTHTGEKPYSCDICHQLFRHKSALTRHILIHTGEEPYSCDICNKRFRHKSALNRHVKIHV